MAELPSCPSRTLEDIAAAAASSQEEVEHSEEPRDGRKSDTGRGKCSETACELANIFVPSSVPEGSPPRQAGLWNYVV